MKVTSGHITVIKALSERYGECDAVRALISVARFNEEERKQLLHVKSCTRKASEDVTARVGMIGAVTKTNLGNPNSTYPSHWVLTDWGLKCVACIEALILNDVNPLSLRHNNDMVDFVFNLKTELGMELDVLP